MNIKKSLHNRIKGWLPKTPSVPKQPSAPSFKRTEISNEKPLMDKSFPAESSTNLVNGIMIGGSIAILLIGLSLWSSLNSSYWSQRNFLIFSGLDASDIEHVLINNVGYIAVCAGAVVYSSYLLIFVSINQLNPTIRNLTNKKISFRLANSFLNVGVIAITFSVSETVYYSYPLASTPPPLLSIGFGTTGTILIVVGVLLMAYLYFKFGKSLTKAQGGSANDFAKFYS
jgi:hypothetical protein